MLAVPHLAQRGLFAGRPVEAAQDFIVSEARHAIAFGVEIFRALLRIQHPDFEIIPVDFGRVLI